MKKYILKNDTINENSLRRVYIYSIYPRGSKIYSDKFFVNIDTASMGGSHSICFKVKKKNCFVYSFCGQPDNFLLNQLPKPKIYHE